MADPNDERRSASTDERSRGLDDASLAEARPSPARSHADATRREGTAGRWRALFRPRAGKRRSAGRRGKWPLFLAALCFLVLNTLNICITQPRADGFQNLTAGYQLLRYGNFATRIGKQERKRDNHREPLPGVIWAAVLAVHPVLDVEETPYRCIVAQDKKCLELVAQLKFVMVLFATLAVLLTGLVVQRATGQRWLALLSMAGAATSAMYVAQQDRFYSEGIAALLVVAVSVLPVLGSTRARASAWRWAAVGTCFALLVLTKAIFYYGIVPYIVIVAWHTWLRTRDAKVLARTLVAFAAPIAVLVGGWLLRNYDLHGSATLTRRGGDVLYSRHVMNEMLYPRYGEVTAYYAGGPFWQAVHKGISREERDMFRGQGERGFRKVKAKHRAALRKRLTKVEAEAALIAEAKAHILSNIPRHVAMSLPVALRGTRVADDFGFPNNFKCTNTLGKKHFGLELPTRFLTPPFYFNWLLFLSLFACGAAGLAKRQRWLLFLAFPAAYCFTMYAGLTHFIPRYSAPLVPIVFATLALVCHLLLTRLVRVARPHGARAFEQLRRALRRGAST